MKPIEYTVYHPQSCNGALSGTDFILILRAYQKVIITARGDFIYKKNFFVIRTKNYFNHRLGQINSDYFQLIYGSANKNNILELSRT